MGRNRFGEGINILIDLRRSSLQATEEIGALHFPTTVRPRSSQNQQLNWVEHTR